MGVWHKEVVRLNGRLMAYVEMQDDWSGNITKHIREIYCNGNNHYCNVLKHRVMLDDEMELYLSYEAKAKTAIVWFNKTKF